MTKTKERVYGWFWSHNHTLLFWPLIALGAKLAVRAVLNLWDMIES